MVRNRDEETCEKTWHFSDSDNDSSGRAFHNTKLPIIKWREKSLRVDLGVYRLFVHQDVVYDLQKNDTEPPSVEVIRHIVNQKLKKKYSTDSIKKNLQVLDNTIPGLFHYDSQYAYVESSPDVIRTRIAPAISESFPIGIQDMVISLFGDDS